MKPQSFTVLKDSEIEPRAKAGTTIYDFWSYDYGLANDDTRLTGKEHRSFTLDPNGGFPFFTMPIEDVSPLKTAER